MPPEGTYVPPSQHVESLARSLDPPYRRLERRRLERLRCVARHHRAPLCQTHSPTLEPTRQIPTRQIRARKRRCERSPAIAATQRSDCRRGGSEVCTDIARPSRPQDVAAEHRRRGRKPPLPTARTRRSTTLQSNTLKGGAVPGLADPGHGGPRRAEPRQGRPNCIAPTRSKAAFGRPGHRLRDAVEPSRPEARADTKGGP